MYENNTVLSNSIGIFPNALTSKWCNDTVTLFEEKLSVIENKKISLPQKTLHGVSLFNNSNRVDSSIQMHNFGSFRFLEKVLKEKIKLCFEEYWSIVNSKFTNDDPPWNALQTITCKLQKSTSGGGFTKFHHEQTHCTNSSKRFAVWMVYLNSVRKGGTTDFPNQNLQIIPEKGKMVIFPASFTHPHRSSPDLKETKYIATGWFVYKDTEVGTT